jgi:prepilin-type N-terminal cleavage/methylation domain-containing protein
MRRFGFTIVELLVVLAIVALIMGLFIPALGVARLQTRTVVCSSNIKQILDLLAIYEQQNGVFPYGFDDSSLIAGRKENYFGDPSCGDKKGKWWFQSISYIPNAEAGNGSIFWCLSRCVKDPTPPKRNMLCGNYGVNRSICKDAPGKGQSGTIGSEYVGTPLNLSQISHPENILLVVDSGYSLISWQGATNADVSPCEKNLRKDSFYVPGINANKQRVLLSSDNRKGTVNKQNRDYAINERNADDAINGRHMLKTVNVGYADCHTKRLKAEELFVSEENGIYTNIQTWVPK